MFATLHQTYLVFYLLPWKQNISYELRAARVCSIPITWNSPRQLLLLYCGPFDVSSLSFDWITGKIDQGQWFRSIAMYSIPFLLLPANWALTYILRASAANQKNIANCGCFKEGSGRNIRYTNECGRMRLGRERKSSDLIWRHCCSSFGLVRNGFFLKKSSLLHWTVLDIYFVQSVNIYCELLLLLLLLLQEWQLFIFISWQLNY